MNKRQLLAKNLLFFKKAHIRTILGFAVSTAILVGSLIVGDSVRLSLKKMVTDRLGQTTHALEAPDRFFTTRLAKDLSEELNVAVAPLLRTNGVVSVPGEQRRANRVQILGVDNRFGELSDAADFFSDVPDDEIIINATMAENLDLKPGDELLLRIQKLYYIPRDVPLVSDEDLSLTRRYTIKAIAGVSQFGRFSLRISQVVPNTVYLSLDHLGKILDLADRSNILLVGGTAYENSIQDRLESALRHQWTLQDAGLELRELGELKMTELRSERIFLEPAVIRATRNISAKWQPILTYFVNTLESASRVTPYSFVSAPGPPVVPENMKDNEIIINRWLAKDLDVGPGDSLQLRYYILGEKRTLIEKQSGFLIHSVVPLSGIYADRALMPDYPGLSDQENCRDWEPGIPIDLDKIRPKDEQYWDDYRGIPKAFVTLKSAQRMWGNRFGELTAVRFQGLQPDSIRKQLSSLLHPSTFGYFFRPVREQGLEAGSESVDFSQLFIGLSFFIIVGALLLAALLFLFTLEQRSRENGLYLALGFKRRDVLKLYFGEGTILAITGGIVGSILAILYNQSIMVALKTVWKDIVGTTHIQMFLQWPTIFGGMMIGIILSLLVIALIIRRQSRFNISELQSGSSKIESYIIKKRNWMSLIPALVLLMSVIFILATTNPGKSKEAATSFFAAGSMLLIAGLLCFNYYLNHWRRKEHSKIPGLAYLGFSNSARNKTRSLTLIGLLASGLFIVFTVGANQQGMEENIHERSSGTGGFSLFAESLIPVLRDLNTEKGQEFYGLKKEVMKDVSVVPFRVREGDDASCLNLNRVSNPRLLGVNPNELAERKAFSFVSYANEVDKNNPWIALEDTLGEGIIPGIADETVIIWSLGKTVGDTLLYFDENGKPFRIKLIAGLANSVFQGNLIISESNFMKKYPSISGYRLFLVDTPTDKVSEVSRELSWALMDLGFEPVSTARRLAEFNKVQNTYLSIFLILGGFGMILGTIGIAIIVLRNVNDRRNELALLQSVGFSSYGIKKLVLIEHGILVGGGILLGLVASVLAALPALLAPGANLPQLTITLTLILISINAGFWTYVATVSATSGNLVSSLRDE